MIFKKDRNPVSAYYTVCIIKTEKTIALLVLSHHDHMVKKDAPEENRMDLDWDNPIITVFIHGLVDFAYQLRPQLSSLKLQQFVCCAYMSCPDSQISSGGEYISIF